MKAKRSLTKTRKAKGVIALLLKGSEEGRSPKLRDCSVAEQMSVELGSFSQKAATAGFRQEAVASGFG